MTKYLLEAWEKALTKKIYEECRKYQDVDRPESYYRNVWYQVCKWIDEEIKQGDMLEEFLPFASSFCHEGIKSKLRSYEVYRVTKREVGK